MLPPAVADPAHPLPIRLAEDREPFLGSTVRVATCLPHNGVLDHLLVVVVSLKRCYSGEAFVRLKVRGG